MDVPAMLASKSILLLLFLSAKNTALVVAGGFGFKVPLEALFGFDSACFIAVVGKNAADNYISYRQTTAFTSQPAKTADF